MRMTVQPAALLPEIWLLVGSLAVLLTGSFLPRRRLGWTRIATLIVLAGSAISTLIALRQPAQQAFDGTYAVDTATNAARLISAVATVLVILLAGDELRAHVRQAEICSLLLLATLGTIVLAGAHDLLLVITGFLLASIPLYALIGVARTTMAVEAALKTYLLGSLFGIVLMAGVVLMYGLAGSTSYADLTSGLRGAPQGPLTIATVAVIGGLMFKAGAVPGHYWVPDAAQGSSAFAAAYLTTIPKIGALIAVYRITLILPLHAHAHLLVAVLAVLSMTLGNLAAFGQQDPRRLLGWSAVSQVGYLLVPVAVAGRTDLALPSLLLYLAGYALTNLAAFAVIAAVPERRALSDYTGIGAAQPWLAAGIVISLLGLVGTPPTAVFIGKLTVATAAWDGGSPWLTIAVLTNSVLSLFYYLRWIAPVLRSGSPVTPVHTSGKRVAVAGAVGTVVLGLLAANLWRVVAP